MKGSVYSMIGHPTLHMLLEREQPSIIIYHTTFRPLAIPPASLYCTPFPSRSLCSPPRRPAAASCLCFSRLTASLSAPEQMLSVEVTVGGGGELTEEIDLVLNEAAVLFSRGVTAPLVLIGPLCRCHTPHNSRRLSSH